MELEHIYDNIYYFPHYANIGVIKCGPGKVLLIDSGLDKGIASKLLKSLTQNNLTPVAIINTHSHADHCGGNSYLKERTGLKIYAPELESCIIENTILEPIYFYSGASPIKDLKSKFLMAPPSKVDNVITRGEKSLKIEGIELKIYWLDGHSPGHIGVGYNGILFCADSVFNKSVIDKHKIPFFTDIKGQIKTLEQLEKLNYNYFLPSHGTLVSDIKPLTSLNMRVIKRIEQIILNTLISRKTTGKIISKTVSEMGFEIRGPQTYYLMHTVIKAFLGYLYSENRIEIEFDHNYLYWVKK